MTASPLEVDVAVIGGGLTGVSTALHLVDEGASVALVDRGAIGGAGAGSGGSGRATSGLLLSGLGDHASRVALGVGRRAAAEIVAFTEENREVVEGLIDRFRIDCSFVRRGSYAVAVNHVERKDLEETLALLAEERVPTRALFMTADELDRRPGAPRGAGAVWNPDDAEVDVGALVQCLVRALVDAGPASAGRAHVLERASVRSVDAGPAGVRIKLSGCAQHEEVRASVAVIAVNGWAARVHPYFEGRVTPTRGQGFVTAPLRRLLDAPVHAGWGHELYRQDPDGRITASGFRPDPGPEDVSGDESTTGAFMEFLTRFAGLRIPGLPSDGALPIERRFAGTCALTSDGLPIVGALPGQPALVAAVGFGMRGLSIGFAAGRALARLVARGERRYPSCLSAARFL